MSDQSNPPPQFPPPPPPPPPPPWAPVQAPQPQYGHPWPVYRPAPPPPGTAGAAPQGPASHAWPAGYAPPSYGWPQAPGQIPAPSGGQGWLPPATPAGAYPFPPPAGYPPRPFTAQQFPVAHAAAGHPKRRLGHAKLLVPLITVISVVVIALVAIAAAAPKTTPPTCRLRLCTQPPSGPPIEAGTLYTSSKYGFSLRYQVATTVSTGADAIQLGFDFKHGVGHDTLQVAGQAAGSQNAQAIVQSIASSQFPNANQIYVMPGASVGYMPGYGLALDVWSNNANGNQSAERVLLMAAVKGNLAVVVLAFGPRLVLDPQNGLATHPTGADLPLAAVADPIVNSITWPGSTPP